MPLSVRGPVWSKGDQDEKIRETSPGGTDGGGRRDRDHRRDDQPRRGAGGRQLQFRRPRLLRRLLWPGLLPGLSGLLRPVLLSAPLLLWASVLSRLARRLLRLSRWLAPRLSP